MFFKEANISENCEFETKPRIIDLTLNLVLQYEMA